MEQIVSLQDRQIFYGIDRYVDRIVRFCIEYIFLKQIDFFMEQIDFFDGIDRFFDGIDRFFTEQIDSLWNIQILYGIDRLFIGQINFYGIYRYVDRIVRFCIEQIDILIKQLCSLLAQIDNLREKKQIVWENRQLVKKNG